jgi:hypothetical protein
MSLYLVFGLDIGNVGRANASRPSTKTLLMDWNQRLSFSREVRLEFRNAFAHTGNYVLRAVKPEDLSSIIAVLIRYIPTHKFVVFGYGEFLAVLGLINRALALMPSAIVGRRWTPGIVMDINPHGGIPPTPVSDEKARFGPFAVPRIRIAWKGDILDSQEDKLDNTQREGGWGNLSDRMKKLAGGIWTARSMKSVKGIVAVARSIR